MIFDLDRSNDAIAHIWCPSTNDDDDDDDDDAEYYEEDKMMIQLSKDMP